MWPLKCILKRIKAGDNARCSLPVPHVDGMHGAALEYSLLPSLFELGWTILLAESGLSGRRSVHIQFMMISLSFPSDFGDGSCFILLCRIAIRFVYFFGDFFWFLFYSSNSELLIHQKLEFSLEFV